MSRTGGQSDPRNTVDRLAAEHRVSPSTVKRAARFARAIDEIAAQIAEYLVGLSPLTVRSYLRTRKLQGVMIGGHWRVTESALEGFVAAKVATTPAEVAKVQQIAARALKTRIKGAKGAPEPQD